MDAVFDSVSVATTFRETLKKAGVIFCPISEAVREHPELVQQYLGSVVPIADNFFAALNSAVFTDGSFVYIPKGVRCPMELSTYFRINARNTGQFERTLIIADEGATSAIWKAAPRRCATRTSCMPRWSSWSRSTMRRSNIPRCRTGIRATRKAAAASTISSPSAAPAAGARSKISWTQVETGSAITWKYPSCVLHGEDSVGEFYSVAVTNNRQQADTGTKMIHIGKRTRAARSSPRGSAPGGRTTPIAGWCGCCRGASGARNYTQCDIAADRRPVRRAYRAVYREPQPDGEGRA